MEKVYTGKKISDLDKNYLLSLKMEDITLDLLINLFAFTANKNPKFDPSDFFQLYNGTFYNSENINTTVGRFIFNKLIMTPLLGKHIGYINVPMNGKGIGSLDDKMSTLLLDDVISPMDFTEYIDKIQWIGFATSKFLNSSLTTDLVVTTDKVRKAKEELLIKYKDKIEAKDINTISMIENTLLDMAKEELKDLPDMEIYDSGGRGNFGNNYKQTSIARGVVKPVSNPDDLYVSMSSLSDGIPPEDLHIYADVLTSASLSRAIGTQTGG